MSLYVSNEIGLGLFGGIGVGKTTMTRALRDPKFQPYLLDPLLQGDFWVPRQLRVSEEGIHPELFDAYSRDQRGFAFSFQVAQFTDRFLRELSSGPGVNVVDMPREADRGGYGEANRENMGELLFRVYDELFRAFETHGKGPEMLVYLRVPPERVDIIQERIRARGRPQEQGFLQDPSYLVTLMRLYDRLAETAKKPVITIDATTIDLQPNAALDEAYIRRALESIAVEYRRHNPLHRFTLDEWEAVDHNTAQKAAWEAQRQLRDYLHRQQKILTLAGLVGAGKTGVAELLAQELGIDITRELDGGNDEIKDQLLGRFLADKPRYCFDLQKYLTPKRAKARRAKYDEGKSFVEDRTLEEDQLIFHRRFHEQGFLSDDQVRELHDLARTIYGTAPPSDCMILLVRNPQAARRLILERGRPVEVKAWPEDELRAMEKFYERSGSGAVIEDFAERLARLLEPPAESPTDLGEKVEELEARLARTRAGLHDLASSYPGKGRNFRRDVFFDAVDALGAHRGAKVRIDMGEVDTKNGIHRGHMYQEILHSMLEHEQKENGCSPAA